MPEDSESSSNDEESKEMAVMRERFLQGIGRTSNVLIGSQIREYLTRYFSLGELLLVVSVMHVLLSVIHLPASGFNASWGVLRGLMQSLTIQLFVSFVGGEQPEGAGLLNLLCVLMVAESLPVFVGWVGDDVSSLTTTISHAFSDEVSSLLRGLGTPLVGVTLGLALGGQGLFGQTMVLTGVNSICSVVFDAAGGGELSLAWPVLVLYFVCQVSDRFNQAKAFVDYGLYRASDSVFAGFSSLGVAPHVQAIVFTFLGLALPCDPVWTGISVLVLVQSSSHWFLDSIHGISSTDPVLAGLCIVTAVHFVCLGVGILCGRPE
jgi:hypothetical protein